MQIRNLTKLTDGIILTRDKNENFILQKSYTK